MRLREFMHTPVYAGSPGSTLAMAAREMVGIIRLDDLYNYLTQEAITLYGAVRAQGAPEA